MAKVTREMVEQAGINVDELVELLIRKAAFSSFRAKGLPAISGGGARPRHSWENSCGK